MPARPEARTLHPEAVIVLVTASWCLPCRPARTLLQELQRRWGDRILPLVLDADSVPASRADVDAYVRASGAGDDAGDEAEAEADADADADADAEAEAEAEADHRVTAPDGDPGAPVLSRLAVDHLPTWILLRPEGRDGEPDPHVQFLPHAPEEDGVPGTTLAGESLEGHGLVLEGAWREAGRRIGAVPKLEILALVDEPDASHAPGAAARATEDRR
ncbi:hypothetical protein Bra3105_10995 [Brachybacterium halotolerans subsp. kimchii]|uniref:hypothetical protein n=1 Tax=Brachybacterium halotolerans TaxID=2795215 RepID=UPI001E5DE2C0|nr:hypothetical protein [Brachybacterium halotolerans]UEJ81372.1 hypothetical protein Bra3105_10995 [Brachybacterium halotolerans subsp. kimchii]